jgi:threonylcarbamoyladenosine tRNA methylthiotransferase MtaB
MNRAYTARAYKALIERVCSKVEDMAITTDVLIGFPGERDANFANTLNLVKCVMPMRTHIFTFSRREGTAAFSAKEELPFYAAKTRYHTLNVFALEASYLYRKRFIGKKLPVLVESKRDKNTGLLAGYSDNYIRVIFEGADTLMRKIVPVEIIDISLLYTFGVYRDDDRN